MEEGLAGSGDRAEPARDEHERGRAGGGEGEGRYSISCMAVVV